MLSSPRTLTGHQRSRKGGGGGGCDVQYSNLYPAKPSCGVYICSNLLSYWHLIESSASMFCFSLKFWKWEIISMPSLRDSIATSCLMNFPFWLRTWDYESAFFTLFMWGQVMPGQHDNYHYGRFGIARYTFRFACLFWWRRMEEAGWEACERSEDEGEEKTEMEGGKRERFAQVLYDTLPPPPKKMDK